MPMITAGGHLNNKIGKISHLVLLDGNFILKDIDAVVVKGLATPHKWIGHVVPGQSTETKLVICLHCATDLKGDVHDAPDPGNVTVTLVTTTIPAPQPIPVTVTYLDPVTP